MIRQRMPAADAGPCAGHDRPGPPGSAAEMGATSDFTHPALLLIDLQDGFFPAPELASARARLVEHCNELAAAARASRIPVFNVRTMHKEDKSTWTLKMLEDDQGYLFEGSGKAVNLAELDLSGSIEVLKHRDSAFWNTELLTLLLQHRVSSLVLAGICLETCLAATAADAFAANLPVALGVDATACADPDLKEPTLQFMQAQHRQKLMSTSQLCQMFMSPH